jgi:DNA-binding GntR family transcriptional regulator
MPREASAGEAQMQDLRDLLEAVKSGTLTFAPSSNSEADIREFQATAKALLHADKQGGANRAAHLQSGYKILTIGKYYSA